MLETDGVLAPQIAYVSSDCGCPSAEKRLISQTQSGDAHFFLHDALGSTRALTDNSGTVSDTYRYAAFGELIDSTGITPNKYLFTGQQFDVLTGQYSLRARYYAPTNGRFLSRDTWPISTQDPGELNRYAYAAGNPVRYTDPSGYTLVERINLQAVGTAAFVGGALGTSTDIVWQLTVDGKAIEDINLGSAVVSGAIGALSGGLGGLSTAVRPKVFQKVVAIAAVEIGFGTAIDIAINGDDPGAAFAFNTFSFIAGMAVGSIVRKFLTRNIGFPKHRFDHVFRPKHNLGGLTFNEQKWYAQAFQILASNSNNLVASTDAVRRGMIREGGSELNDVFARSYDGGATQIWVQVRRETGDIVNAGINIPPK